MSASVLNPHEPVDSSLHSKRLPSRSYRFGDVEVDFHSADVRRSGVRLRIQDQPLQVLAALLDRPGEVVTREELRNVLWDGETFVDFDHCLNSAVKRLRDILHDDHDHPRLIETIPRHGYRFIAPVTEIAPLPQGSTPAGDNLYPTFARQEMQPTRELANARRPRVPHILLIVLCIAMGAVAVSLGFRVLQSRAHATVSPFRITVAVLPFHDLSENGAGNPMAAGITQELVTNLGKMDPARVGVLAAGALGRYNREGKLPLAATKDLGADYIIEGTTRVQAGAVRIAVQLVRVGDQRYVWAESYDEKLNDALTVQQSVAGAVIRVLEEKLKLTNAAGN
jgi:TolB-like protein/DNA-binding winged helix-turn-helix (wHTH) protein